MKNLKNKNIYRIEGQNLSVFKSKKNKYKKTTQN